MAVTFTYFTFFLPLSGRYFVFIMFNIKYIVVIYLLLIPVYPGSAILPRTGTDVELVHAVFHVFVNYTTYK